MLQEHSGFLAKYYNFIRVIQALKAAISTLCASSARGPYRSRRSSSGGLTMNRISSGRFAFSVLLGIDYSYGVTQSASSVHCMCWGLSRDSVGLAHVKRRRIEIGTKRVGLEPAKDHRLRVNGSLQMAVLSLDAHRSLFRSEADFDKFVSLMETATAEAGSTPVWAKSRHLATLISREQAKALVQDRILRSILDNPGMLDELKDRLENDEIVE
jgi:hypothetical protein